MMIYASILILLIILITTDGSSKKTVVTITKDIDKYQKSSTKFAIPFPKNDEVLLKQLFSKLASNIVKHKSRNYNFILTLDELKIDFLSFWFFKSYYKLERNDIYNKEDNEYSIIFENMKMDSKQRSDIISISISIHDDCIQTIINGASRQLSKSCLDRIINGIKEMLEKELKYNILLLTTRHKESLQIKKEAIIQLEKKKKIEIDKIIHPEKYSKSKSHGGTSFGGKSGSSRYKPSAELQAKRAVRRG